jgi:hypothetical protein
MSTAPSLWTTTWYPWSPFRSRAPPRHCGCPRCGRGSCLSLYGERLTSAALQVVIDVQLPDTVAGGAPFEVAVALNGVEYVYMDRSSSLPAALGLNSTFRRYNPAAVAVLDLFPPMGPVTGGSAFALLRAQFPVGAVVVVYFVRPLSDNVPSALPAAPHKVGILCRNSATYAACVTDRFPAGTFALEISVDGGRSAEPTAASHLFYFFPAPSVQGVSPRSMPAAGKHAPRREDQAPSL